jgi:hypothetical protein
MYPLLSRCWQLLRGIPQWYILYVVRKLGMQFRSRAFYAW